MKKASLYTLLCAFALSPIGLAGGQQNGGNDQTESVPVFGIGRQLNGFSLADSTGEVRSLSSLKGKKGTLIVFISTKCPYSNAYNERVEKIARDYKPRGVSFVGVNANANELPEEIKRHATQHGLTFPILKDEGNKLADELGARVTPQAFLFDSSNKLIYQGRVDNSKSIEQVKSHDLRDALEAFLSGASIEKPTMRAFGCTIERVKLEGTV